MEIVVTKHGLSWWLDKAVRCPDCDATNLTIDTQSSSDGDDGVTFTAEMTCNDCSCEFTAEILERT